MVTEQMSRTPRLALARSASLTKSLVLVEGGPGVPHLLQGVVGGVVKGVSAAGPAPGGEHLLLLVVQQRLHVLYHDCVSEAMGLQEDFDSLDAGEGHSDVDGGSWLGRAPPKIQLGRTRATVTAGWERVCLGRGVGTRISHIIGDGAQLLGEEDAGNSWVLDKVQFGQGNGPGSRVERL